MDAHRVPVTVIVPCYNEEEGIPALVARLRAMRRNPVMQHWTFLFIDDGSNDGTFAELLRAARDEPWIEVVRHHENLGLGAALRTAFAHTSAWVVCTIDSDCTYPPERLPELTALIEQGADIVTASAWHPETDEPQGSSYRLLLSRFVSRIYKLLIGQDIHTFTCLFRAYRRDAVERTRFRSNGFAAVAEIMLRAILAGYQVREVPMALEHRRYGESKLRVGDAVIAHLRLITLTLMTLGTRFIRHSFWA